jgi:hypothetical protein
MDNSLNILWFKRKVFKNIPRKIRKNIQYFIFFTYNFMPYHMTISLNENLLDSYTKYKWPEPILTLGDETDDIPINFDWRTTKLILCDGYILNDRYQVICNVQTFDYSVFKN